MKKILIVDDQTFNQTLLEAYIHQYSDLQNEPLEIRKANNGIEAVILCKEEPFDLIFMDIVMPVMNGIEATKLISAVSPETIIVIVSTQGDEENQIKALRNGAKDYFIKPIQPDVFKRRLELYLTLINTEKGVASFKKSCNPFTNSIFCYKTTYLIENEEDLSQLWESLQFKLKESVRTNFLSDLIRFMYQLCLTMLSRSVLPKIIIEEDESYYFFLIVNVNIIPSKKIIQLVESHFDNADYQLSSNLLSFKVAKEGTAVVVENISSVPKEPVSVVYEKETQALKRFDFMEEEDLSSLELRLGELSTQFIWMGSNDLSGEDVDQIVDAFERISSIMLLYSDTQKLGIAIRELTSIIQRDRNVFITMASQMSSLCKSFNNDLILWFKSVFYEGAPSIDYMDASILSNIQMIQSFLEPAESTDMDNSDGFEFF